MRIVMTTDLSRLTYPLLMAACLAGCHGASPTVVTLPKAEVVSAEPASVAGSIEYPVRIEARDANDLALRVGGKLIERRVHLGDVVRAGQVLARLDPADAQLQLADASAGLSAAEHRLQFADQQLRRDQAQAALNLIAKAQLEQSQDSFAATRAARDQAASQWRQRQRALDYQTLRADHDGVITAELDDTGAVLSSGQPVYRLAWSGAIDAVMDVAGRDIDQLRIGQLAEVRLTELPLQPLFARVREKATQADGLTGSFRVKLSLLHADATLPLGLTGSARLQPVSSSALREAGAVKIPASALFHQGDQPAVWVLQPVTQVLALRPVTPARYEADAVILSSGLAPGERVVAAGTHTVYAGERIEPIAPLFSAQVEQGGVQ